MDSDTASEGIQTPRLGTIEESSLENLILQYEEEIKDLRTKLAQARAPSALVQERGYQAKQRKSLEQVSDLFAFGDTEEAASLWRELGFVPMENERWDEVYLKLQQVALSACQHFEQQVTTERAKNFKLETDLRTVRRSLRETENEVDLLKQSLPASKRSQDPAEVIVLRMQIKALEEGISSRDKEVQEMATEVSLLKSEENRLKLIVENLKMETLGSPEKKEDSEDFSRLMQKIQDLTEGNIALGKKIDQQSRLKAIIDEQNAVIHRLKSAEESSYKAAVSESQEARIKSLEAENELEKQARAEAVSRLQDTISHLECTHSEETVRLTKQLTVSEGLAMQVNMRVHSLEEQLAELLEKLSQTEKELYTERGRAEKATEQKESALAELQRLGRETAEQQSVSATLRSQMAELSTKLSESQSECGELQFECESLRAQLSDLRAQSSLLDSKLRESEQNLDQELSTKLAEITEARKQWEGDRKQQEERIRGLNKQIEVLETKLAEAERTREEQRIDLDINSKKMEVIEDDYKRLEAAYEAVQTVSKAQCEAHQTELSQMKETVRHSEVERQLLESRVRILEETREEHEKLLVTHNLLSSEHLKCENRLLKLRMEFEAEQDDETRQREALEAETKQAKARYQYVLNAFRIRETELMSLKIASEQWKVAEGGENRRKKNGAFDGTNTGVLTKLKTAESTISELQQKLISLMSAKTKAEGKNEHQTLTVSFPQGELEENEGKFIAVMQKVAVDWLNSLPEWLQKRLADPHIEDLLEIPQSVEAFTSAFSKKLREVSEILVTGESSPAEFNIKKANQLLDRLDRGEGPIESAIFLNFLIEVRLLHDELLRKNKEMIETNTWFQPSYSEQPENEKEIWAIQRWHDAEKETARLRNEHVTSLQRLQDFFRSREAEKGLAETSAKLKEENEALKAALEKSQSRAKDAEMRLEANQTLESQKSSYEGVLSALRTQLSKAEGELQALKSAWDRVISGLKVELMDFGGEYQPSTRDTPETALLGIVSAWKSVRVGLNQRISELEKRLASWASERDSFRLERSALEQAKEQARQEADRFRAENKLLRVKIEENAKPKSEDVSNELEMKNRLQALTTKLRGELDEVRVALAAAQQKVVLLESQIQTLSTENAGLKASDSTQSQNMLKDLQTKSELIERLVGDNENTKQKFHRKELALLEMLSEKDEALKRSQLETVQLTTASWSFRRRSKGGSTHKQVS